jgi:hypothetical protein
MSSNSQDQEIDLGQVFSKIGSLFQKGIDSIFDVFLFLKKNSIILGVLLILGFALGYLLDKKSKKYNHEIIITPNFGSVEHLYSKIALLDAKKKENDSVFIKGIGIKKNKEFKSILVEPIIDIYKFTASSATNFELIKLMAEDGDLEKIMESDITSKSYPFHVIKFSTSNETTIEETVTPLLNYFNESDYFSSLKEQFLINEKIKMSANDSTISQINELLNDFSNTTSSNQKSDKLVYYNENNQLNEIIKTKDALISEQGAHRINLISNDKIIKDISTTINIIDNKGVNGKMKFILPFFFFFFFVVFAGIKNFYKTQIAKRKQV